MDLPAGAQAASAINSAVILVDDVRASSVVIEDGLKELIDSSWDWCVRKLSDSLYSVVFPSSITLRLCRSATGMTLPDSLINVVVADQADDLKSMGSPSQIWVQSH